MNERELESTFLSLASERLKSGRKRSKIRRRTLRLRPVDRAELIDRSLCSTQDPFNLLSQRCIAIRAKGVANRSRARLCIGNGPESKHLLNLIRDQVRERRDLSCESPFGVAIRKPLRPHLRVVGGI